jgi:hypothetical protein
VLIATVGRLKRLSSLAAAAPILFFLAAGAKCQSAKVTPEQLIRALTYNPDDRKPQTVAGCGADNRDLKVASSLAKMGQRAVQPLEEALDSLEQNGEKSPFARVGTGWLLVAYAKIKGPAADVRLRRMSSQPRLAGFIYGLDNAIALEQSITSRVSASRELGVLSSCIRPNEPRWTLDLLILAWIKSDRHRLEESLGPRARHSLNALLREFTFDALWAEYWTRRPARHAAVGYKFNLAGPFGEPYVTLEPDGLDEPRGVESKRPRFETVFKTSSGRDCGTVPVELLVVAPEKLATSSFMYLVDNPDLSKLLRTISECATE